LYLNSSKSSRDINSKMINDINKWGGQKQVKETFNYKNSDIGHYCDAINNKGIFKVSEMPFVWPASSTLQMLGVRKRKVFHY